MRMIAALLVVLACAATTASAATEFNLIDCIMNADAFNKTACMVCDVALGSWCDSAEYAVLCPDAGASSLSLCGLCHDEDQTSRVQNARTSMALVRHNCGACKASRALAEAASKAAAAGTNQEVPELGNCPEMCDFADCIEKSSDPNFGGSDALQCREAVVQSCTALVAK